MDAKNKLILKQLDSLIKEISDSETDPSKEVLDLITQIESDIKKANDAKISEKQRKQFLETIVESIKKIEIQVPQVNYTPPEIKVNVPQPKVVVKPPKVEVNVPEVKVPPIKVPETKVVVPQKPLEKPSWLDGIFDLTPLTEKLQSIIEWLSEFKWPSKGDEPIPVQLYHERQPYKARGGAGSTVIGGGGGNPYPWPRSAQGSIGATPTGIKDKSGVFGGYYYSNQNTDWSYIQIFDRKPADITLGTTPPRLSYGIPPKAAANVELTRGLDFGTAISIAITTTRDGAIGPSLLVDYNIYFD